jgi:hypothetical protein
VYALGRIPHFDPRSLNFPVRTLLPDKPRRSYTWRCGPRLDQGREGACVGFGWAHELAARPVVVSGVTDETGRAIYHEAQQLDQWPGQDYEGTSVLAGAQAVRTRGNIVEYRWCFGEQDLALTVGYRGPVVIGVNWWTGMFSPDPDGLLHPTGQVEGGHCVLVHGYSVKRDMYRLRNSWGRDWGLEGDALMWREDMARLLAEDGEGCVPVRVRVKA